MELGTDAIPASQPAIADDGSIHFVLRTAATTSDAAQPVPNAPLVLHATLPSAG